jgi:hypothetical protein
MNGLTNNPGAFTPDMGISADDMNRYARDMARVSAGTDGRFNFNITGGDPDWNAFAHVMGEFGRAMGE